MKPFSQYGAFNARWLSPEAVAKRFVPLPQFRQLVSDNHSVLMGPRGCGKTTLLKMLTPRALITWQSDDRSLRFRDEFEAPNFRAIYFPADIRWLYELESLDNYSFVGAGKSIQIQRMLVMCNVCMELMSDFEELTAGKDVIEAELSQKMIKIFKLSDTIPTFSHIRTSFELIVSTMRGLLNQKDSKRITQFLKGRPPLFFGHALDVPILLCNLVAAGLPKSSRPPSWALCFDELEISPEWIRAELITSLRSVQQGFLLKLTWSPILPTGSSSPEPLSDFKPIRLWNSHLQDPKPFCENLTKDFLATRFSNLQMNPQDFLGTSVLAADEEDEKRNTYDRDSTVYNVFRDLVDIDPSFESFLIGRGVSPSDPVPTTPQERDQVFRKIKPIALLRREFNKGPKARSRKVVTLYAGREAVYAVSEGNPRWLLGLLNDIADLGVRNSVPASGSYVPYGQQAKIINSASHRFLASLKAYAASDRAPRTKHSLFDFLDRIANYFQEQIHVEPFTSDPPGSFELDPSTDPETEELVRRSLELGALVNIGNSPQDVPYNLKRARFRLTFLLAPIYKLPLRNYRSVRLTVAHSADGAKQLKLNIE